MIRVVTICDWLTQLDIPTNKKIRLWIDICQIPPRDDTINIFYACEPSCIAPHVIPWIQQNYQHFNLVLGYESGILSCPNSRQFFWSRTWITEQESKSIEPKKFQVSFITGNNYRTPLHGERFACWMRQQEITIPKKFFYSTRTGTEIPHWPGNEPCPKESKFPAFSNSMFHIAVENCKIAHCFTEKIFDCFVTMTVPIYLGCPNIGDYFDINGIIVVNSVDEIISVCNNLTENDYYSRLPAMEKNKNITLERYPYDFNKSFAYHLEPILNEL